MLLNYETVIIFVHVWKCMYMYLSGGQVLITNAHTKTHSTVH